VTTLAHPADLPTARSGFYQALDRPLGASLRIGIALLVIPLLTSLLLPLWTIRMQAPQYPSGLRLDIYAYTIQGGNDGRDLREINTLNHYIGMKKLDPSDFADLDWIPFAIGGLALLALRVAAIGDGRALVDLAVLTIYFSLFSAGRFVFKMWWYGHHLDPTAPIDMEPFMPAILGTQQIGNFSTQGYPLSGSLLLGVFVTGVAVLALWHLRSGMLSRSP
jgi:copper chaperone NosL